MIVVFVGWVGVEGLGAWCDLGVDGGVDEVIFGRTLLMFTLYSFSSLTRSLRYHSLGRSYHVYYRRWTYLWNHHRFLYVL